MLRNILMVALVALFALSFVACGGNTDASASVEPPEVWPTATEIRDSLADGTVEIGDGGFVPRDARLFNYFRGEWERCVVKDPTVKAKVVGVVNEFVVLHINTPSATSSECIGYVLHKREGFLRQSEEFLSSDRGQALIVTETANAIVAAHQDQE